MHKTLLIILLLTGIKLVSAHNLKIEIVRDTNPLYPEQIYVFPLLKGSPVEVADAINKVLLEDFLWVEGGEVDSGSIFSAIWGTAEFRTAPISDLTYNINTFNNQLFSITFSAEGCGAYCEGFSRSYNFDLATGARLKLNELLTVEGAVQLSDLIVQQQKDLIQKTIEDNESKLLEERQIDSEYGSEYYQRIQETIELFQECLSSVDNVSYEYLDYSISVESKTIQITLGRCSAHVNRALDEIGEFNYTFTFADMSKYLSANGNAMLNIK